MSELSPSEQAYRRACHQTVALVLREIEGYQRTGDVQRFLARLELVLSGYRPGRERHGLLLHKEVP